MSVYFITILYISSHLVWSKSVNGDITLGRHFSIIVVEAALDGMLT